MLAHKTTFHCDNKSRINSLKLPKTDGSIHPTKAQQCKSRMTVHSIEMQTHIKHKHYKYASYDDTAHMQKS